MEINFITNMRMPTEKAHGQQMMRMSDAFQENGVGVKFFHPKRKNLPQLETDKFNLQNFYGLKYSVKTHEFWALDFMNLSSHPIFQRPFFIIQQLSFVLSLRVKKKSMRGDTRKIYYLRDLWAFLLLKIMFSKKIIQKTFLEIHSLSQNPRIQKFQIKLIKKAPGIICVTHGLKDQLMRGGIDSDKILVAHDGVDLDFFEKSLSKKEARDRLNLQKEWTILSFVGKFHTNGEEKGITQILDAAQIILQKYPHIHFLFVGGPMDWANKYLKKIHQLDLPLTQFHFFDRRPSKEVPLYLWASDILLMPHPWTPFYAYQVSPLKMFEYMASKRPIVASKLPAIMEVLSHKKNALLASAGSPQDIAWQAMELLNDQKLAEEISRQAFEDVQEYTWKKRAQSIIKFIEKRLVVENHSHHNLH